MAKGVRHPGELKKSAEPFDSKMVLIRSWSKERTESAQVTECERVAKRSWSKERKESEEEAGEAKEAEDADEVKESVNAKRLAILPSKVTRQDSTE